MKERKEQAAISYQPSAFSRQRRRQSEIRNPKSEILLPGLTLIELVVSVAILVIMILAFGMIITQTQKVVSGSQATMRTNNTAASIARVIRQDLQKLTKNGFLCITSTGNWNSRPRLLFSTAGVTHSRLYNYTGMGGISIYGLVDNNNNDAPVQTRILFHEGWVAFKYDTSLGNNDYDTNDDMINCGLEDMQKKTRVEFNTFVDDLYNNSCAGDSIRTLSVPPENLTDIQNLWKVLIHETNRMGITWTDGSTDTNGNINWYGIESYLTGPNYYIPNPLVSTLPNYVATEQFLKDNVQFDYNGGYRALWTRHNQNNWPKAIKIKFRTYDPNLSEVIDDLSLGIWYEVICPIGQ